MLPYRYECIRRTTNTHTHTQFLSLSLSFLKDFGTVAAVAVATAIGAVVAPECWSYLSIVLKTAKRMYAAARDRYNIGKRQ